jgi:hypothetical protein
MKEDFVEMKNDVKELRKGQEGEEARIPISSHPSFR